MMRMAVLALVTVLTPCVGWAQDIEGAERDSMYVRYLEFRSLIRGAALQPQWLADGNRFWFYEGTGDARTVTLVDPASDTREPFFDLPRLRRALEARLGFAQPTRGFPFKDFTVLDDGVREIRLTVEDPERGVEHELALDRHTYGVELLAVRSEAEKNRFVARPVRPGFAAGSPDVMEVLSNGREWFATERDNDLWLRSTYDGRVQPVTDDAGPDVRWEVDGAKWSPDDTRLAVRRVDRRAMLRMPLLHWLKPYEEVEWVPYTRAGGPMPLVELFVVDVYSRRRVRVDAGDSRDQHLHIIGWLPDGSELLFYRMARDFKRLEVLAADPTTGATRVVIEERQPTFIKGIASNPGWRDLFTLLPDGERFLWISERTGWDHIYLYRIDGTLVRGLTTGEWPVLRILAVDPEGGWVYFTGHAEERVYDTHLYRVGLDGRGFRRLSEAEGQNAAVFSPSKRYYITTHSSIVRPPAVELRRSDGEPVRVLARADVSALEALRWRPPEEFVVKAADGVTDLHGVLYKPHDFDPAKSYPVIDFIYNGPQTTWVARTFDGARAVLPQAMAQLGFITFSVDGRGTVERGKAFQDVVYRNFGRHEIPDHVAALRQLAAARPYMDTSRVGITGGSWGGYMTIRALVLAPEVYKVGVSTVPVADFYDHSHVIEAYMDLPDRNPEGYEYGSSIRLADRVTGQLLMIAGTSDVNATFSSVFKMAEALIRAGRPHDLLVMPGQNHWFVGASNVYAREATRRYFERHLLGRAVPETAVTRAATSTSTPDPVRTP